MPTPLMLATLTDRHEFGDDWLLQRKYDGERVVARKDGDGVQLESRNAGDDRRRSVGAEDEPSN